MLVNELAREEEAVVPNKPYEVWSPYDSAEAAAAIAPMLREDQQLMHLANP
jgi:hypothetical protein